MTYAQAKTLLDKRRAGADMPASVVFQALELTGDLDLDSMVDDVILKLQTTGLETTE